MPTLWETITSNSGSGAGSTLWEHLNSPKQGSCTGTVNYFGNLEVDISSDMEVNLGDELSVTIENSTLRVIYGNKQSIIAGTQHRVRQGG